MISTKALSARHRDALTSRFSDDNDRQHQLRALARAFASALPGASESASERRNPTSRARRPAERCVADHREATGSRAGSTATREQRGRAWKTNEVSLPATRPERAASAFPVRRDATTSVAVGEAEVRRTRTGEAPGVEGTFTLARQEPHRLERKPARNGRSRAKRGATTRSAATRTATAGSREQAEGGTRRAGRAVAYYLPKEPD